VDDDSLAQGPSFVQRTLSSLRCRNFRLFFIGQTISQTGNWLTNVALTLLILHRTGSGVALGLLVACQYGPILLLSAWAGVIVDRTNKRNLLYITQALEMCESFALAALAFIHNAPLAAFYGIALAGGALLALDNPVRRTFVNEMVPRDDITNAVTLYSAMNSMARIAGPAFAGLLIVTVGYGWCFTVDAVSYVAVITALAMMRTAELRRLPMTPRGAGQVRAGLKYIFGVPDLWITFVMLLLIGTMSYNFAVVFPLFVEKGLHGGDGTYALVYSAFSAGGLVGALLVARRSTVSIRTVAVSAAGLGAAMLVLSAVPSVALAYLVATLVGAASVASRCKPFSLSAPHRSADRSSVLLPTRSASAPQSSSAEQPPWPLQPSVCSPPAVWTRGGIMAEPFPNRVAPGNLSETTPVRSPNVGHSLLGSECEGTLRMTLTSHRLVPPARKCWLSSETDVDDGP
jgi:MFS family permease